MASNILFFLNHGCSSLDLEKLILRNPIIFVQKLEWLEDIVQRVEKEFCICRDSRMFYYGVEMSLWVVIQPWSGYSVASKGQSSRG
uniref:Uncharacterized protein n=1 Tax=Solanum lycopersicum TaxID=4081 RepID=A0A3Q7G1X5_SOLLC